MYICTLYNVSSFDTYVHCTLYSLNVHLQIQHVQLHYNCVLCICIVYTTVYIYTLHNA